MIIAVDGPIEPRDLPSQLAGADSMPIELRAAVDHFEQRHIAWVLQVAGGNRERAATMLGVDPATLYRRLAKHGMK